MNLAITSDIFKSNNCNTNITMAIITVRIPDEMKKRMDSLDEINWSSVIRNMLEAKIEEEFIRDRFQKVEKEVKEGRYENFEDVMDEFEKKFNLKLKK